MDMGAGRTPHTILAVDPGRSKCGLAVVSRESGEGISGGTPQVLHREVVRTSEAVQAISDLLDRFDADTLIIGGGTSSSDLRRSLTAAGVTCVEVVDEKHTTMLARRLYFREHPPRGLRRFIPVSLQTPPCPYDDYVAVILALRRFESSVA